MKERAVYYCRVSTEEENQQTSILHQKEEAKRVIREQGWELVDEYIDEGRSGTTTKHRSEYKRMNEDMEADRFDILVVKSQDRLMRNTREWYFFLDRLLRHKKKLYFYLEQRFYSSEDALLTGIKAILAEDYSRSLSRNINHAHQRRQQSGSNVVLTSRTWGYDKKEKQIVVNEPEAEMIRLIYELAAQDYGSRLIAGRLAAKGYRNRTGGLLAEQTVRRIIRNPLYKGTARMHTQHRDFETKQVERIDEKDWIYHEHAVPAIISEEIWERANQLMDRRRILAAGISETRISVVEISVAGSSISEIPRIGIPRTGIPAEEISTKEILAEKFSAAESLEAKISEAEVLEVRKAVGKNRTPYPFSGKIRCGLCGSIYWRRTRRRRNHKKKAASGEACSEPFFSERLKQQEPEWQHLWSCRRFLTEGKKSCQNIHLSEPELEQLCIRIAEESQSLSYQTMLRQEEPLSWISEIRVYPSYLEVELSERIFHNQENQQKRIQVKIETQPGNKRKRTYRICW